MKSPLIRVSQICRRGDRIRAGAYQQMHLDAANEMIRVMVGAAHEMFTPDPVQAAHQRAEAKRGMH